MIKITLNAVVCCLQILTGKNSMFLIIVFQAKSMCLTAWKSVRTPMCARDYDHLPWHVMLGLGMSQFFLMTQIKYCSVQKWSKSIPKK